MPRFLHSEAKTRFSNFYINLDAGVGLNRPNRREDVLLVQFFLEALRPRWGGQRYVKMDGVAGSITIESIHGFQTYIKDTYYPALAVDKAVDPTMRPTTRYDSTLGWMHDEYLVAFPKYWPDIRYHPAWTVVEKLGLFTW